MNRVPGVGIIGMGGYAVRHHEAVMALESSGEARLVSTCDPSIDKLERPDWRLGERGVRVFRTYCAMLDHCSGELDVVTIPTPIPLHAEMHSDVVRRGLAAYLEKPPTLDPGELEVMITRDAAAPVQTLVGFNFTTEPVRKALKMRLLSGEFGRLHSAGFFGWWPRSEAYYRRAGWAGRLVGGDGRLILDSCLGNGFAHYVHNLLQWAGEGGVEHWASPVSVRADLRRAHDIQGADTAFVEARTDSGVLIRIALSHACRGPETQWESLHCTEADIIYQTGREAAITWRDGRTETIPVPHHDGQIENLRAIFACLRGERTRPPTTLADSRPFVHLNALAYLSSCRIENFDPSDVEQESPSDGFFRVHWLRSAAEDFVKTGRWPGGEPDETVPSDLGRLNLVIQKMARCGRPVDDPRLSAVLIN